ncbi:hypothetical protein [Streptomyces sp. NPDC058202]|uniref:hypothetical protein n=1 Tax=Streptomyces sp. NPDC058202 TaxID=3346380 RepID=UPI0036E6E341
MKKLKRWFRDRIEPEGMRPPSNPPLDQGGFAVVSYYVNEYEKEFVRIRNVSKVSVSRKITLIATLNAGIAILGVASAAWKYPWFGLGSTLLAGIVGVLAARNNLFRDQELWQLRSEILSKIQQIKRDMQYRVASGEDGHTIAPDILRKLDDLLERDLAGWSGVANSSPGLLEASASSQNPTT